MVPILTVVLLKKCCLTIINECHWIFFLTKHYIAFLFEWLFLFIYGFIFWFILALTYKWMCVKLLQSCPTLWNLMDCNLQGSSVSGTLQARILEQVTIYKFSAVQFSHSVVSNSLWPHEPQHSRPPCPSPTPGVYPNSCPLSWWCHLTISSSVIPFSSCLQSFPASVSFPAISYKVCYKNLFSSSTYHFMYSMIIL